MPTYNRLVPLSDINQVTKLVAAIKPHHIFARNTEAILYYHSGENNSLSILGAYTNNDELLGIHFFEKISFKTLDKNSVYGCLLIASPESPLGTGLSLLEQTINSSPGRYIATNVSPRMKKFHERLGVNIYPMDQYFLINKISRPFSIIHCSNEYPILNQDTNTLPNYTQITNLSQLLDFLSRINTSYLNQKTPDTIAYKYLDNPFHSYQIYALETSQPILLVTRKQFRGKRYIVKIIEIVAAPSFSLGLEIASLIKHKFFPNPSCEAAYIICHLIGPSIGFHPFVSTKNVSSAYDVCVPSYFHPFIRENSLIYCATNMSNVFITSGDSDQDRASK